jgi:NAD(P)-dependent dehydrogenase (short-subunit alcohol dehydrogenase family)
LSDHTALVVGARTKLGHQVVVKLLSAGATVIGTTRYPASALQLFRQYKEWPEWEARLHFYPSSLDLDSQHIQQDAAALAAHIEGLAGRLDVLVLCAAQTIRWAAGPRLPAQSGQSSGTAAGDRHPG